MEYIKYYGNAGITIKVISDLPIKDETFLPKIKVFEIAEPTEDVVTVHHHFKLPSDISKTGRLLHKESPWEIYEEDSKTKYFGFKIDGSNDIYAEYTDEHNVGHVYHRSDLIWNMGGLESLTAFVTDQILIARLLSKRKGVYFHSAGAILNGKGSLFAGHSTAGKTTMSKIVKKTGEILCDDRNIVRKTEAGYILYGSWSHGELSDVSASFAPLKAIYLLNRARENKVILMEDKKEAALQLLSLIIRPAVTKQWWEETIEIVYDIVKNIPIYQLYFDKSGDILKKL